MEYILCAAVWYDNFPLKKEEALEGRGIRPYNVDRGIVFSGWRHTNCVYQAVAITGLTSNKMGEVAQGFLTNQNRFVDRKEGAKIAVLAGQCDEKINYLHSEDLY